MSIEPGDMPRTRRAARREEARQFLVQCEGCSFEQTIGGREDATRVANRHNESTGHPVIAIEIPPVS